MYVLIVECVCGRWGRVGVVLEGLRGSQGGMRRMERQVGWGPKVKSLQRSLV